MIDTLATVVIAVELRATWPDDDPFGMCYAASEALQHTLGVEHWKPVWLLTVGGNSHWYLSRRHDDARLDITWDQFDYNLDYSRGVGKGFLTKQPSQPALDIMWRLAGRLGLE